jgi:predicted nucleic acid-binding protein
MVIVAQVHPPVALFSRIILSDGLNAACAVAHRAELWTPNRKHYPMKEVSFFD